MKNRKFEYYLLQVTKDPIAVSKSKPFVSERVLTPVAADKTL